jgi:hypothetical protein
MSLNLKSFYKLKRKTNSLIKLDKKYICSSQENKMQMAFDMRRCCNPLIIREMKIKTTSKYHFTLSNWQNSKSLTIGCGEIGTPILC